MMEMCLEMKRLDVEVEEKHFAKEMLKMSEDFDRG